MGRSIPFDERCIPEPNSGCWLWIGAMSGKYGSASLSGKTTHAQRLSWTIYKGPIPKGIHVLHKCDVPSRVNPDHLFLGTHQDNMDDKVRKGRSNVLFGEIHGMARLTEAQVLSIRSDARMNIHIAIEYKITPTMVGNIKKRKAWRHI